MLRQKKTPDGKILHRITHDGELHCTYYPNGMLESKKVVVYGNDIITETYKEYDFYNRITKTIEKINGKIVTSLNTDYRFYKGTWFYKRYGIYNGRNIVLNGIQEKGGAM